MWFTPSSTARRSTPIERSRSLGRPRSNAALPVRRMAPNPSRLTVRSPSFQIPAAAGNEERSALLAEAALRRLGVDATEVARLVRLTASHDASAGDRNGALLADADLAILASSPDGYDRYARAIRREYAHVPEDRY